jgi:hypothetical protein
MRYGKHKKPLIPDTVADDIILEGAAVHSIQSTYHERDFALHAMHPARWHSQIGERVFVNNTLPTAHS